MTSGIGRGEVSSTLSRPRIQCGTFTGSVWTLSSPSFFISATAHPIASSNACDPLRRLPNVSPISASRSQANELDRASPTSRAAGSRNAFWVSERTFPQTLDVLLHKFIGLALYQRGQFRRYVRTACK